MDHGHGSIIPWDLTLGCFSDESKNYGERRDDFSIPPTSGIEYIRRVQQEASLCPEVVVADIQRPSNRQTKGLRAGQIHSTLTAAPAEFIPCLDWQLKLAASFAELRQTLNRFKSKTKLTKVRIKMPHRGREEAWCILCLGKKRFREYENIIREANESEENPYNIYDEEEDEENHITEEGKEPLLSLLNNMNQPTILKVLEYHIEWMGVLGFTEIQGKWIFALLAWVEKPLLPEVSSFLRTLARVSADIRATLPNKDDENLSALNILITLVTRYFDQTDLAENG